jgi:hypothetical protein
VKQGLYAITSAGVFLVTAHHQPSLKQKKTPTNLVKGDCFRPSEDRQAGQNKQRHSLTAKIIKDPRP